jgi:hypothetical protein
LCSSTCELEQYSFRPAASIPLLLCGC